VVKYHGLARRYLSPQRLLVRPLLNGGTLAGLKSGARRLGAGRIWHFLLSLPR
jgi:hypothetical protein